MNKKTLALTEEQYKEIIDTIRTGFLSSRPNQRIATALVLEANLGLRISDILQLRLKDIVKDGERYRLDIVEQKTGKSRTFTVPVEIYQYIQQYCIDTEIKSNEAIFPISERAVQKHLKAYVTIWDMRGYQPIASGSSSPPTFIGTVTTISRWYRLYCSTVQQPLLRGIWESAPQRLEQAIQKNINLL